MCGICGWFRSGPATGDSNQRLQEMMNALRHRGPDGSGALALDHATFGHTRLAIIDPLEGLQPMSSSDGHVHITFNGEIYNFRELRRQLEVDGHRFRTHSDTEVIVELYRRHGHQGFEQLRGMFAFAIWDEVKKTGFLVRDPFGIKPLFMYPDSGDDLVFASEAKGILAALGQPPELDVKALHLLMNFRYLPTERTLFEGISQLPPATILEWRPGHAPRSHRLAPPDTRDHDVESALRHSVARHLVSDVEVGVYLSGGLDSAAVAALARELLDSPLRSFTLNVGDDPDEAANAARSAALLGLSNTQGNAEQGIEHLLPRLIWHLEVPKVNALQVNQLARLAAKDVKVALSGLGGDELFYGYNAHRILHLARRTSTALPRSLTASLGRSASRALRALAAVPWTESERAARMLANLGNWPRVYGLLRNVWDAPGLREQLYGPRLLDADLPDAYELLEELWPDEPDPVAAMARFEWRRKLVNDLLWQEDRASMAEGLEVRVPFVDAGLYTSVQRLDRKQLMRGGRPKAYMKEMLSEMLPAEIMQRPKSGFQVAAPDFFQQHLKPLSTELLGPQRVREEGLFNPAFVETVLGRSAKPALRWHYFMLYLMLMTHLWVDVFQRDS